jgi:hypothetical protein
LKQGFHLVDEKKHIQGKVALFMGNGPSIFHMAEFKNAANFFCFSQQKVARDT